jgi:lipopolysaccharide export LptBFGC system permease protein LptF
MGTGGKAFQDLIAALEAGTQRVGVYFLELAGAVIVVMIIWAGLQYIQGNAEAGKKTLTAALIGAVIIALASLIIQLVKQLGGF